MASALDGKTLPSSYWDKLLTITGVSALPIVAVAVLVLRAQMTDRDSAIGRLGSRILVGATCALLVVLAVVMICLYEIVMTPALGRKPGTLPLWVATLGAALTIGSVGVSVAAAALDKIDDPVNS